MINGTPTVVTNGLVFNIDANNPKSVNTPIVNLLTPLPNWSIVRSTITLVTGGTITPPIDGAPVYKLVCGTSFANTLHRYTDNSILGTFGNGFYQYSLYVRGESTNNPTASIQIDIGDGNSSCQKSFLVGTASTWTKLSTFDNNTNNITANNFFDFSFSQDGGNSNNTGDTFYISAAVAARSLSFDNNTYVPLKQDPGYIPYSGIINTGVTDMVGFNNTSFIKGRQGISRNNGGVLYTSGDSITTQQFFLDRGTDLPEWSLGYWFKPLLRDEEYLPSSINSWYASGRTTIIRTNLTRFTGTYTPRFDSDGSIFIGSYNEQYQNISRFGIAKINSGGTINTDFNANINPSGSLDFNLALDDNYLYLAGTNIGLNRVDKTTGVIYNTLGATFSFSTTTSLTVFPIFDNYLYVSGEFTTASGVTRQRLTRVDRSTFNIDLSLNTSNGFNGLVRVLLPHQGKLLCLGNFTTYSGVSRNNITRINTDGTLDETFQVGSGFDSTFVSGNNPMDMAIDSLDRIVVVGRFSSYSGISRTNIVRLNPNGDLDSTFNIGTGFLDRPFSLAIQSDDKIVVGGVFTSYSGVSRSKLVRLNTDGTIDTAFNMGNGINAFNSTLTPSPVINFVRMTPDNKILLVNSTPNDILTYSSSTNIWKTMIKLNLDGSIDTSFNAGSGYTKSAYRSEFSFQFLNSGGTLTTFSNVSAPPGNGLRTRLSFFTDYHSKMMYRFFTKSNSNVLRQYDNGVLVSTYTFNPADDLNLRMRTFNTSGEVGAIQIYNRELSQNEVVQNFNSLRTRYNT